MTPRWRITLHSCHGHPSIDAILLVLHNLIAIELLEVQIRFVGVGIMLQKPEHATSFAIEVIHCLKERVAIVLVLPTTLWELAISRRTGDESHSNPPTQQLVNRSLVVVGILNVESLANWLVIPHSRSQLQHRRESISIHLLSIDQHLFRDVFINHTSILVFLASAQIQNHKENGVVSETTISSQIILTVVLHVTNLASILPLCHIINANILHFQLILTRDIRYLLHHVTIIQPILLRQKHRIHLLLLHTVHTRGS